MQIIKSTNQLSNKTCRMIKFHFSLGIVNESNSIDKIDDITLLTYTI